MNRSILVLARRAPRISSPFFAEATTAALPSMVRSFSTDHPPRHSYHVEVSNLEHKNRTQIVVTGPGRLGLLASMCVTLANKGGSIKELHAADSFKEGGLPANYKGFERPIRDVICVVDYKTGQPFLDDELQDLAESIMNSTRSPMKVVSAIKKEIDYIHQQADHESDEGNITVIQKDRFKGL